MDKVKTKFIHRQIYSILLGALWKLSPIMSYRQKESALKIKNLKNYFNMHKFAKESQPLRTNICNDTRNSRDL